MIEEVRLVRDEELDEVMALDRRTLPEAPPRDDTVWWGAFDGDELVGYAGARFLADGSFFLSRAGVVPAYRGQGIQKRMIRARVRYAARHAAKRCVTYTVPYNAPSANSLIACGFKIYDPKEPWAGEDVIYWQRPTSLRVREPFEPVVDV